MDDGTACTLRFLYEDLQLNNGTFLSSDLQKLTTTAEVAAFSTFFSQEGWA